MYHLLWYPSNVPWLAGLLQEETQATHCWLRAKIFGLSSGTIPTLKGNNNTAVLIHGCSNFFSQSKNILPAFFTELKSRLISLTAKSTWKGAICHSRGECINHDKINFFQIRRKCDTVITCSRRIRRCLMWNKWASRVVLFVIIWAAAFAKAAQAAAKTSF